MSSSGEKGQDLLVPSALLKAAGGWPLPAGPQARGSTVRVSASVTQRPALLLNPATGPRSLRACGCTLARQCFDFLFN